MRGLGCMIMGDEVSSDQYRIMRGLKNACERHDAPSAALCGPMGNHVRVPSVRDLR